jgi:pyridoxal phosphate-dependent aminotransferase EpsN
MPERIYLSPPHMSGRELVYLKQAFESNWIAPLGPFVDRFEADFCRYHGGGHAAAVASGTGALHMLLDILGITTGDRVY